MTPLGARSVSLRLYPHLDLGAAAVVEELRAQALKDGMGQPDDIAALAVFLCGAQARHIQGTATAVDGGATPGFY